ncbi:MAG: FAD-dependent oxidoreductase [Cytophagales bacterium]|nr:FAD-binding oxidoreductase [Bernardetiaceae bacterium]MDW8205720.1 FAD-dependent oxidoreductase [Cytophagales bacterium]
MAHYFIVGQGIAGTVLAYTLLRRGHVVHIADNNASQTASKVAAGLFNPITGYRMTKTWLADLLFPFLHRFYPEMERYLGARFFYPLPMYRPFESVAQQNEVLSEISDEKFAKYVEKVVPSDGYGRHIYDPFGGIILQQCGYVDLPVLLTAAKSVWKAQGIYRECEVSESEIYCTNEKVYWQDLSVDYIIYCRGWKETASSLFHLPFRPVKGEILQVRFTNECYDEIINRSCWILPHPDKTYRVGATYHQHDLSPTPSAQGWDELTGKLSKLTSAQWALLGRLAGIRPATYDRRPFIGIHPQQPRIGIFNGLGAKGVSLAPYFATVFAEFLEGKTKQLPLEVAIERCIKV